MKPLYALLLAGALVVVPSCKKKDDPNRALPPATNWQDPAAPSLGAPAMGGHAGPRGANPHGPAGMPNDDVHAGLGGEDVASPDPTRPIDDTKYLEGEIVAADSLEAGIPANSVIYLSVKMADPKTKEPMGAPLAVHRIDATSWPVKFKLTERHQMRQGDAPFEGEVVLVAWTDQDGEAQTKQPGDVVGQVSTKIPDAALRVVLDTVIQ